MGRAQEYRRMAATASTSETRAALDRLAIRLAMLAARRSLAGNTHWSGSMTPARKPGKEPARTKGFKTRAASFGNGAILPQNPMNHPHVPVWWMGDCRLFGRS
jgi:hypothetical protein